MTVKLSALRSVSTAVRLSSEPFILEPIPASSLRRDRTSRNLFNSPKYDAGQTIVILHRSFSFPELEEAQ